MLKFSIKKPPFIYFLILLAPFFANAQYPSGFAEDEISNWNSPMAMAFDEAENMFVAERAGKIYKYHLGQKTLLLDISEEVATYGDFGLLSFALDPNFSINGYIYLYYVVDRHHLLNFGTPNYNANTSEQGATISRLTRYTVSVANNFNSIVPDSRFILIGETKSTGFPLTGLFHAGGDLAFSVDGTLLVSCGDGASGADYEAQALADQILSADEYNNRRLWRCQMNNSLNGKIVRIDPATGNGVPSNPIYDSGFPRSAASRVWAKGFRNPFRFNIKPNTGDHNSNLGQPGIIVVGDVGQETNEEINFVTTGGQNFGWPKYEGINYVYSSNPAFEPVSQTLPKVEWNHGSNNARVVINNVIQNVGSPSFPFTNFNGGCVIAGPFYEGSTYPVAYQNQMFVTDYNNYWMKIFGFENNTNNPNNLANVNNSAGSGVVKMTYNHHDESIYYASVFGKICRIKYNDNLNKSPIPLIIVDKKYGPSGLSINFNALASTDPENEQLTFNWAFGDGSLGNGPSVSHVYTAASAAPQAFTAVLTVTDTFGNTATASQVISVNNTPPKILSTSIDTLNTFSETTPILVNLAAEVIDAETPITALSYKWQTFLYHNDHSHPEYSVEDSTGNFTLEPISCDPSMYFYRIIFTVTDANGLAEKFIKDIHQKCNETDTEAPQKPKISVENFDAYHFTLKWTNPTDNVGIKSQYLILNEKTIRLLGNQTSYEYTSNFLIENQPFEAQVIVVDSAGNSAKTAKIKFTRPPIICPDLLYLSDKTPKSVFNAIGSIQKDKSHDGNTLTLNGITFAKGLGVHASSIIEYDITNESYTNFQAKIGIDDERNTCGSMIFKVFKDNILAYTSPLLYANSNTENINLDITGTKILKLEVDPLTDNNCDHADWADAKIQSGCAIMDKTAPNYLENIFAKIENDKLKLEWDKAIDNTGLAVNYEIFLDGIAIANQADTSLIIDPFSNGLHEITIQAIDNWGNITAQNISVYRCNASIIQPNEAQFYDCTPTCDNMHTIKSGNWADPSIWYCNKVPNSFSEVIISSGHIVTLSENSNAFAKSMQNNGEIILETGAQITLNDQ